jgi:hypothetical protein
MANSNSNHAIGASYYLNDSETYGGYALLVTPGMPLNSSDTSNISRVNVTVLYTKTSDWNGSLAARVQADCVSLANGAVAYDTPLNYTSPSWTVSNHAGASTGRIKRSMVFNDVLNGRTCGVDDMLYLKFMRGAAADGDTETGSVGVYGWIVEIAR